MVVNHDNHEPPQQEPGVPHGSRQHHRSERPDHLSSSSKSSSSTSPTQQPQSATTPSFSADELRDNPVLLAQVTAYLQENHLHLPLLTPDIGEMRRMKETTPELYQAYVKAINAQIDADHTARTLPYTEPGAVVRQGQRLGIVAVIAVLVFCAYMAYLGHSVSASIIATFDLVALASVFASSKDEKK